MKNATTQLPYFKRATQRSTSSGVTAGDWRPLQPYSWRARQHQKLASEHDSYAAMEAHPKTPEKRPACDRVGVTGETI